MKRLSRTAIQVAILSSLAFLPISLNTSLSLAQQKQDSTTQTTPTRRGSNSVMLTVTVTDRRSNYVKGLTASNFTVSDGKQEQQIISFSDADVPLSVGILFDTSASVKKVNIKRMSDALRQFFQSSHKANEYFLIGFNNGAKLLQDWTTEPESIIQQIDAIQPNGNTALYDACYSGIAKVMTGRQRKLVLILISDGQDSNSRRQFTDVNRMLEEYDVLLYSVGIMDNNGDSGSSLVIEGQEILKEFSSTTGGIALFPDKKKSVTEVFETIATELRNQYSIGFTPTVNDKNHHSLKVRVIAPADAPQEMQKLTVRSRKKFYAQKKHH